jgi:hypothetical protein
MKGQFFLISGLIIIVVLLLIKSSLNLAQIIESKRYLEIGLERKEFSNIRDGLVETVELSYNKNETNNVEKYIVYVRQRLKARTTDLNGLAVGSSFKKVVSGSDTGLNVTVFNFLDETIQSLNLTFYSDPPQSQIFSNVADNSSVKKDFTFSTTSDVNYTLIVNYTTSTESKQYSIQIPAEIGKSKFIGFFDLRMISLRGENRDEFSKIVETA